MGQGRLISDSWDHLRVDERDLEERHLRVALVAPQRSLQLHLGADHRSAIVDRRLIEGAKIQEGPESQLSL